MNRFKLNDFKSGKGWRLKIKDSFLNWSPISRIMNRFKKSFSLHLKSVFCTSTSCCVESLLLPACLPLLFSHRSLLLSVTTWMSYFYLVLLSQLTYFLLCVASNFLFFIRNSCSFFLTSRCFLSFPNALPNSILFL